MKKNVIRFVSMLVVVMMLFSGVVGTASAVTIKPIVGARPIVTTRDNRVPMLKQMQEKLKEYCKEYGVPYYMAISVINAMSDFNNSFVDDSGSVDRVGFMGVPVNSKQMFSELSNVNVYDAYGNLRAGTYILGWLKSRHDTWEETLLCYDVGEANAMKYFIPWDETTDFVTNTMRYARIWRLIVGM